MKTALEFHDSEVGTIVEAGGCLRIVFRAATIHRSEGEPGVDAGTGWIQPVELALEGASEPTATGDCSGELSDGALVVDDREAALVPLPFSTDGQILVRLVFKSGGTWSATAASVSCRGAGDARYVETFPGATRHGDSSAASVKYPLYLRDRDGFMTRILDEASLQSHVEQIDAETGEYTGWDSSGRPFCVAWAARVALQDISAASDATTLRDAIVRSAEINRVSAALEAALPHGVSSATLDELWAALEAACIPERTAHTRRLLVFAVVILGLAVVWLIHELTR
jgi:hypothetical protein